MRSTELKLDRPRARTNVASRWALHNIYKKFTGVAHGHVEALTASRQLWGHRAQVSDWRSTRGLHCSGDRGWGGRHHDYHHGVIGESHAWGRAIGMEPWESSEIRSTACRAPGRRGAPITSPTRFPTPPKAASSAGKLGLTATARLGLRGPFLRPPCAPGPPITSCGPTAPAPCWGEGDGVSEAQPRGLGPPAPALASPPQSLHYGLCPGGTGCAGDSPSLCWLLALPPP